MTFGCRPKTTTAYRVGFHAFIKTPVGVGSVAMEAFMGYVVLESSISIIANIL